MFQQVEGRQPEYLRTVRSRSRPPPVILLLYLLQTEEEEELNLSAHHDYMPQVYRNYSRL